MTALSPRATCYRCRRPKSSCFCSAEPPMATRTRIVLLMHPREFRRETCTTGRLTCLNLANSEIIMGLEFDDNERVMALVADPQNYPVVLYPCEGAMDITAGGFPAAAVGTRQLVVFLLDATWINARKMLQRSPSLLRLPRLMFTPREPSRFVIKRQPRAGYLSTLETTHELLLALDAAGLDAYPDKTRLLRVFTAMQDFQIGSALHNAERAADPTVGTAGKMPRRATRGTRRPGLTISSSVTTQMDHPCLPCSAAPKGRQD